MIGLVNAGLRHGDRWIFRKLDLTVPRGASVAVLGPNGRGKTTLIRAIMGLLPLSEGRRETPALMGYVPQAGASAPRYSVLDMVVMGRSKKLGVFGSPSREDYATAHEALATVGLSDLAGRPYSHISGGERQLVLVARALATGAETIVLDEPASALDLANQSRLLTIITDLHKRGGYTILFSTHLPQHALHAADEAILMMGAGVTIEGPTSSVLTEANLEALYGIPVRRIRLAEGGDAVLPVFGHAARDGGQPRDVRREEQAVAASRDPNRPNGAAHRNG